MALSLEAFNNVMAKHKEELTSGQMEVLQRAGTSIKTGSYVGAGVGLAGGTAFVLRRKMKMIPAILVAGTGMALGQYMGMWAGAASAINAVKQLPEDERKHVMHVLSSMREEIVQASTAHNAERGLGAGPGGLRQREAGPRDPDGPDAMLGRPGEMVGAGRSIEREPYRSPMNADPTFSDLSFGKSKSASEMMGESNAGTGGSEGSSHEMSRWAELQKARSEKPSKWEKIRQGQQKDGVQRHAGAGAGATAKTEGSNADMIRSQEAFDAMMERERQGGAAADENSGSSASSRKNKYGDPIE